MLPGYKDRANMGFGIGFAVILSFAVLCGIGDAEDSVVLKLIGCIGWLAGVVLYERGCCLLAKGKGYHLVVGGLLGIFFPLTFVVLLALPDKTRANWYTAARQSTSDSNPKHLSGSSDADSRIEEKEPTARSHRRVRNIVGDAMGWVRRRPWLITVVLVFCFLYVWPGVWRYSYRNAVNRIDRLTGTPQHWVTSIDADYAYTYISAKPHWCVSEDTCPICSKAKKLHKKN